MAATARCDAPARTSEGLARAKLRNAVRAGAQYADAHPRACILSPVTTPPPPEPYIQPTSLPHLVRSSYAQLTTWIASLRREEASEAVDESPLPPPRSWLANADAMNSGERPKCRSNAAR
jgi:hypothetical protein